MGVCIAIHESARASLSSPALASWSCGSREGEWPSSCAALRQPLTRVPSPLPPVPDKSAPSLMDLLALGVTSALAIGAGLGAGILLDSWLHTSPLLTFIGLFLGVLVSVVITVRTVRRSL